MQATITILGSGTSTGVPVIGCACATCTSDDPLDKRTRSSLLIEVAGRRPIIIDTSPDFRAQVLRAGIKELGAVLYTHLHADHTHGFDDVRAFSFVDGRVIPCYIAERYLGEFKSRFAYAFHDTGYQGSRPLVEMRGLIEGRPFVVEGLSFLPVAMPHGHVSSTGYRLGKFVYITDFKVLPAELRQAWRGQIDTMVASGIHMGAHQTHSNIPETIKLFEDLQVRRGIITHLAHEARRPEIEKILPSHVRLAHDGLKLAVDLGL